VSATALPQAAPATAATEPKPRLRSRIAGWLSAFGLVCTLMIAGLMLVPGLLGYQRYVIVSGSMEPAIPTGSVVYDEIVPVSELAVGDIITFVPPAEYGLTDPVTHRIVEIEPASGDHAGKVQVRTKGDANEAPDAWTAVLNGPDQARVKLYMALSNRWVQLLVIGLPALLIGVLVCVSLWQEAGEGVEREEAEATAKAEAEAAS
jgi:signal peptidase I